MRRAAEGLVSVLAMREQNHLSTGHPGRGAGVPYGAADRLRLCRLGDGEQDRLGGRVEAVLGLVVCEVDADDVCDRGVEVGEADGGGVGLGLRVYRRQPVR